MKRLMELIVSLALLTGVLSGCAGTPAKNNVTDKPENTPAPTEISQPEASSDAAKTAWPRVYIDALGNEVVIESKPEKVVSTFHAMFPDYFYTFGVHPLAVAAAETRFNHLSAYKEFLAEKKPEDIGPADALNFEKILSLAPDLIIATKLQEGTYPQLSQIAPTIILDHTSINANWKHGVEEFAKIFGEDDQVEEIISVVEKSVADGTEILKEFRATNETVIFIAITGKQVFPYPVTQLKTVYNPIDEGGLGLIAPEAYTKLADYSQPLSLETLATDYNPDHIFIIADNVDGDAKEYITQLEASTVWNNMHAVKNNHIYKIDRSIFGFNAPIATQFGVSYVVEKLTK